jgi:hypothetical protein
MTQTQAKERQEGEEGRKEISGHCQAKKTAGTVRKSN